MEQIGFATRAVVWDDPEQGIDGVSAVVVRSCWDYHLRPGQFLAWADALHARGVRLLNPAATLRWNHDKRYLRELELLGVPIPETVWFEPGASAELEHVIGERGWRKSVLKPAVSATAWNTFLVTPQNAASLQTKFCEMLASGAVMVQKFLENIGTSGEWSFVFFGGQFSHAVLKRPQNGDFRVQAEFGGRIEWHIEPAAALIEQAYAILGQVKAPWRYARVDCVEVAGCLCLVELELIEPALFLNDSPALAARFANAVAGDIVVNHVPSHD